MCSGSHLGRCPKLHSLSERLSILVNFRLPTLLQLRLPLRRFRRLPDFHLYSLPSPQHLALQVETSTFAGIVDVEQLLEALHHILHVCFAPLWRLHVQDLAGFVERETGGCEVADGSRAGLRSLLCVFLRRRSLSPCFCDGAAEDSGADDDDLSYYPMRLAQISVRSAIENERCFWLRRKEPQQTYH